MLLNGQVVGASAIAIAVVRSQSCRVRSLIWLLLLHQEILGNAPCTLMETVG
ncbi:hypothetical protein PN502_02235 [Microcystis aeruginosa CS-338/01]|nr:hypothetical protein [Microcystis aeruginosa CS-338/01]